MFIYKYGWFFRLLYPDLVWRVKTKQKQLYLTFDDGPIPEVTEFVLDTLKQHQVKATFFCVGANIEKHPDVFSRIIQEGHHVANHTFNHLRGSVTEDEEYYENVALCENQIADASKELFRPPYGRIKRAQIKKLKEKYQIIMWEVLAGDFLKDMTPEKCLRILTNKSRKGSIVLLHDSVKTYHIIKEVLPHYLDHFKRKGYKFQLLG